MQLHFKISIYFLKTFHDLLDLHALYRFHQTITRSNKKKEKYKWHLLPGGLNENMSLTCDCRSSSFSVLVVSAIKTLLRVYSILRGGGGEHSLIRVYHLKNYDELRVIVGTREDDEESISGKKRLFSVFRFPLWAYKINILKTTIGFRKK